MPRFSIGRVFNNGPNLAKQLSLNLEKINGGLYFDGLYKGTASTNLSLKTAKIGKQGSFSMDGVNQLEQLPLVDSLKQVSSDYDMLVEKILSSPLEELNIDTARWFDDSVELNKNAEKEQLDNLIQQNFNSLKGQIDVAHTAKNGHADKNISSQSDRESLCAAILWASSKEVVKKMERPPVDSNSSVDFYGQVKLGNECLTVSFDPFLPPSKNKEIKSLIEKMVGSQSSKEESAKDLIKHKDFVSFMNDTYSKHVDNKKLDPAQPVIGILDLTDLSKDKAQAFFEVVNRYRAEKRESNWLEGVGNLAVVYSDNTVSWHLPKVNTLTQQAQKFLDDEDDDAITAMFASER